MYAYHLALIPRVQVTGILGIKAYRCLNNSRLIAIILVVLRVGILVMLGLDLSRVRAMRRLSSRSYLRRYETDISSELYAVGCIIKSEPTFLPIMITLMFAESLFLFICCETIGLTPSSRDVC